MFAILHALGMLVANLFKSQCRLETENLLLRHQLRDFPCYTENNSLLARENSLFIA